MDAIPLFKVFMAKTAAPAVTKVLESGYVGQGPVVDEFEAALAEYIGNPYVATVNSGTSALHLAVHLIKDLPGDEILTTPLTCTATNFPILANGLKLRWVDVDADNYNLCLEDLRRKLSPKTKAIMVVHWGGDPVDLDALAAIQDECEKLYGHRPPVIEDCAHALGSEYKGKRIGSHGNICTFSFQAIKHLTTVDGGMLTLPTDEMCERVKLLRWFGLDRTRSADFRCEQNISEWGFKFQMNDMCAAIGLENLKHLPSIVEKHKANAAWLTKHLAYGKFPEDGSNPAYWIYTINIKNRDEFIHYAKKRGVCVSRVHDRNDKHACLQEFKTPLPALDKVCESMVCIPCGWWLSEKDLIQIRDVIEEWQSLCNSQPSQ